MKTYKIKVMRPEWVIVYVKAETEQEAIDLAYDEAEEEVTDQPWAYGFEDTEVMEVIDE